MPLLEMKGVTQRFGGLQAVSDFNISLEERKLIALIGPNGAGKTTVFNLVSGSTSPPKARSSSTASPPQACGRTR